VKCEDVVRAEIFDEGDDVLSHSGEDRRDDDHGQDADDDPEHSEERSKLVRHQRLHRHGYVFALLKDTHTVNPA